MHQNEQLLPQARTNDLVTQEMPDEVLVYDLKNHKAHCLNQTAAAVWKHCDGKTSVMEMTSLIKQDINQTMDEASVWHAIERLSKADLLDARVAPPAEIPRFGRREALRKLGLGGAIAVPVVMSILAPTVLAGCTITTPQGNGISCCFSNQCQSGCCSVSAGNTCVTQNGSNKAPGVACSNNNQCCSNVCAGTCQGT